MDLGGSWRAIVATDELRRRLPDPELDDRDWACVEVPGHWRSAAAFADTDGPVILRRPFTSERAVGRRSWLTLAGVFYQGDVWLDGSYLGDTEGYFAPHTFEITDQLTERSEHVLAVEVTCSPPGDRTAKRNLTGVFQDGSYIDPGWNPGGLWAPVTVTSTGTVRMASMAVRCVDARAERATLELEVELDAATAGTAVLETEITRSDGGPVVVASSSEERLAAGPNRVRWRMAVERPALWWPRALGDQPLYRVAATVTTSGEVSDQRVVTTGLRRVRTRNYVTTVNGERLFLKGANLGPTRRALAEATAAEVTADVDAAVDAGLDLLRVHAHVARPELYDAADRRGLLLWQDLPLLGGYAHVRHQAVAQARDAVALLGHHPSVALWCGHSEPLPREEATGARPVRRLSARSVAVQVLPNWNRTVLDRSIRRALEQADGTRPVVAHSGVLPHPAGGTDSHLYLGWEYGEARDLPRLLARLPVLARFVSEFGAQAVPATDGFLEPDRWPDLDWEHLSRAHALQKDIVDDRVPPHDHATLAGWRAATQAYQAEVIRTHVEALRRLKYRPTGGFCQFLLADAQPAVSWSVLDHHRVPKAGYAALASACAPVVVLADPPGPVLAPGDRLDLAVHVVSDLRVPLTEAVTTAVLSWPGGERSWRFGGEVPADGCVRVGRVGIGLPDETPDGPVRLGLRLSWSGPGEGRSEVTNRYDALVRVGK